MGKKYTVTIHNDSDLLDDWGAIHTWLEIRDGEKKEYLSFGADETDGKSGMKIQAGMFDGGFKCLADDGETFRCLEGNDPNSLYYDHRRPTESYTIEITEEQYEAIKSKYYELKESKPTPLYALIPDPNTPEIRNCSIFARDLLLSAGVKEFENVRTPEDIKHTIEAYNRGLSAPTREELDQYAVATYEPALMDMLAYLRENSQDLKEIQDYLIGSVDAEGNTVQVGLVDHFKNGNYEHLLTDENLMPTLNRIGNHALALERMGVTSLGLDYVHEHMSRYVDSLTPEQLSNPTEQQERMISRVAFLDENKDLLKEDIKFTVDALELLLKDNPNLTPQEIANVLEGIENGRLTDLIERFSQLDLGEIPRELNQALENAKEENKIFDLQNNQEPSQNLNISFLRSDVSIDDGDNPAMFIAGKSYAMDFHKVGCFDHYANSTNDLLGKLNDNDGLKIFCRSKGQLEEVATIEDFSQQNLIQLEETTRTQSLSQSRNQEQGVLSH